MRANFKFFLPLLLTPACLSGSAHAATCFFSNLSACNVTENGVQFSGFTFTGFTPGLSDSLQIAGFSNRGGEVNLLFNPSRANQISLNASINYTVTLIPTPLFNYTFDEAFTGGGVNSFSGTNAATVTLSAPGLTSPATFTRTGSFASATTGSFQPQLTSQTFTQSFTFNPTTLSASLNAVVGSWTASANPVPGVPGPLPLLGAATAFGLSRKLRSRIRSAA
ncbi:hypothetical protein KBZ12_06520 [Cyanobium sp. Cruz CV13-4-11]|jgi:hypothetical protein|uniref:hypothetical protein n=1 Tax=unclassified Cyanobium TaxID=2627006 RepID=UPI0020CE0259|nr:MULTISPECIES: hypothetical protein [unclassified Cyanobium]MCP9901395.1 hypothetical protein [Cyanobium sp. Cruz CV11-17]MCP9919139.1 hypothetical protein [Cyanobium sp. Cruz CV13-4-11]